MSRLIFLATAAALILSSVTVLAGAYRTPSVDRSSTSAYDATEIPLITNAI